MNYLDMIHPNFGKYTIQNDIIVMPFWKREFCEYLIQTAEAKGFRLTSELGEPIEYLNFTDFDHDLFQQVNDHYISKMIPILKREWTIYEQTIERVFTPYILRYKLDGTQRYWKHTDYGMVSLNVKLNDTYKGAHINFPRQKFSTEHVPVGHAIIWPSQLTHPHYVNDIEEGTKYSVCIFTPSPPTSTGIDQPTTIDRA